jgi:cytosine/adenosine deaminase-related metal-dependent hydrolase
VDVVSLNSGDLWHELRFGLGSARAEAADPVNAAGAMPERVAYTARESLQWCTVNAAEAMGLGDQLGSLTPGKRADLMLVGGPSVEQHPRVDPYATLAFQTTAADVRTVLVEGRAVKRDGVLLGTPLSELTARADAAADRIMQRLQDAGRQLPGTPEGAWAAIDPMARMHYEQALQAIRDAS